MLSPSFNSRPQKQILIKQSLFINDQENSSAQNKYESNTPKNESNDIQFFSVENRDNNQETLAQQHLNLDFNENKAVKQSGDQQIFQKTHIQVNSNGLPSAFQHYLTPQNLISSNINREDQTETSNTINNNINKISLNDLNFKKLEKFQLNVIKDKLFKIMELNQQTGCPSNKEEKLHRKNRNMKSCIEIQQKVFSNQNNNNLSKRENDTAANQTSQDQNDNNKIHYSVSNSDESKQAKVNNFIVGHPNPSDENNSINIKSQQKFMIRNIKHSISPPNNQIQKNGGKFIYLKEEEGNNQSKQNYFYNLEMLHPFTQREMNEKSNSNKQEREGFMIRRKVQGQKLFNFDSEKSKSKNDQFIIHNNNSKNNNSSSFQNKSSNLKINSSNSRLILDSDKDYSKITTIADKGMVSERLSRVTEKKKNDFTYGEIFEKQIKQQSFLEEINFMPGKILKSQNSDASNCLERYEVKHPIQLKQRNQESQQNPLNSQNENNLSGGKKSPENKQDKSSKNQMIKKVFFSPQQLRKQQTSIDLIGECQKVQTGLQEIPLQIDTDNNNWSLSPQSRGVNKSSDLNNKKFLDKNKILVYKNNIMHQKNNSGLGFRESQQRCTRIKNPIQPIKKFFLQNQFDQFFNMQKEQNQLEQDDFDFDVKNQGSIAQKLNIIEQQAKNDDEKQTNEEMNNNDDGNQNKINQYYYISQSKKHQTKSGDLGSNQSEGLNFKGFSEFNQQQTPSHSINEFIKFQEVFSKEGTQGQQKTPEKGKFLKRAHSGVDQIDQINQDLDFLSSPLSNSDRNTNNNNNNNNDNFFNNKFFIKQNSHPDKENGQSIKKIESAIQGELKFHNNWKVDFFGIRKLGLDQLQRKIPPNSAKEKRDIDRDLIQQTNQANQNKEGSYSKELKNQVDQPMKNYSSRHVNQSTELEFPNNHRVISPSYSRPLVLNNNNRLSNIIENSQSPQTLAGIKHNPQLKKSESQFNYQTEVSTLENKEDNCSPPYNLKQLRGYQDNNQSLESQVLNFDNKVQSQNQQSMKLLNIKSMLEQQELHTQANKDEDEDNNEVEDYNEYEYGNNRGRDQSKKELNTKKPNLKFQNVSTDQENLLLFNIPSARLNILSHRSQKQYQSASNILRRNFETESALAQKRVQLSEMITFEQISQTPEGSYTKIMLHAPTLNLYVISSYVMSLVNLSDQNTVSFLQEFKQYLMKYESKLQDSEQFLNVLNIYYNTPEGYTSVVTPHMQNGNLEDLLENVSSLGPVALIEFCQQFLQALSQYYSEMKEPYGSISPKQIYFNREGQVVLGLGIGIKIMKDCDDNFAQNVNRIQRLFQSSKSNTEIDRKRANQGFQDIQELEFENSYFSPHYKNAQQSSLENTRSSKIFSSNKVHSRIPYFEESVNSQPWDDLNEQIGTNQSKEHSLSQERKLQTSQGRQNGQHPRCKILQFKSANDFFTPSLNQIHSSSSTKSIDNTQNSALSNFRSQHFMANFPINNNKLQVQKSNHQSTTNGHKENQTKSNHLYSEDIFDFGVLVIQMISGGILDFGEMCALIFEEVDMNTGQERSVPRLTNETISDKPKGEQTQRSPHIDIFSTNSSTIYSPTNFFFKKEMGSASNSNPVRIEGKSKHINSAYQTPSVQNTSRSQYTCRSNITPSQECLLHSLYERAEIIRETSNQKGVQLSQKLQTALFHVAMLRQLITDSYGDKFQKILCQCLNKNSRQRPSPDELLKSEFLFFGDIDKSDSTIVSMKQILNLNASIQKTNTSIDDQKFTNSTMVLAACCKNLPMVLSNCDRWMKEKSGRTQMNLLLTINESSSNMEHISHVLGLKIDEVLQEFKEAIVNSNLENIFRKQSSVLMNVQRRLGDIISN